MSRNQNGPQFDIPLWVIALALVFSFPVGVILAILKIVFSGKGQQTVRKAAKGVGDAIGDFASKADAEYEPRQWKEADFSVANPVGKKDKKTGGGNSEKSLSAKVKRGLLWVSCLFWLFLGWSGIAVSVGRANSLRELVSDILFSVGLFGVSGLSYLAIRKSKEKEECFDLIRAFIGERDSVELGKIVSAAGKKPKKIRKYLQQMISKGEFGEGAYIDASSNCFMRNADAVPDVTFAPMNSDVDKMAPNEGQAKNTADETESDEGKFRSVILEIRRLNDEIHDFAVSEKIYRIEEHTQNIFDYVTEHPEAMPATRTFMNYYLPTTLKLLESYSRIERMGVAGENMQKSKEKIESILDLLVTGFEQQVDQLFANESIDISSDITTLETMMQMNGLGGRGDIRFGGAQKPSEVDLGGAAAQEAEGE
ncbi:MAG: hypothetical protein E7638_09000 [Ruminococcaceae bacterium]|nr:hypothetical protein [Oscillospiraceae bacterium]